MTAKIRKRQWLGVFSVLAILILVGIALWYYQKGRQATSPKAQIQAKADPIKEGSRAPALEQGKAIVTHGKISQPSVIDLNEIHRDESLKAMLKERKERYGLDDGVDAIARSDESLKLGVTTIPMKEILDEISLKRGDLIEADIDARVPSDDSPYGIYVVKPGDNIWNIHFRFLKDYLDDRNISVSPIADEPNQKGFSSGIGKILKFSENMVYIYNVRERKLSVDLNLIHPKSKVVVYNMRQVFSLLDQIDFEEVKHIEFDGETIWIPSRD
jgi:hypothetical protein